MSQGRVSKTVGPGGFWTPFLPLAQLISLSELDVQDLPVSRYYSHFTDKKTRLKREVGHTTETHPQQESSSAWPAAAGPTSSCSLVPDLSSRPARRVGLDSKWFGDRDVPVIHAGAAALHFQEGLDRPSDLASPSTIRASTAHGPGNFAPMTSRRDAFSDAPRRLPAPQNCVAPEPAVGGRRGRFPTLPPSALSGRVLSRRKFTGHRDWRLEGPVALSV